MDHDHGDHSSDTSSMMSMGMDEPFCEGEGRVMLSGFQEASGAGASCVLFLFQNAVVDTEAKYAIAVIGVFFMGFANEMIRYWRGVMGRGATSKSFTLDLMRTFAFAVQMLIAYFLMLLVMLYEYIFLIMIILGLSVGHLVTLRLAAARKAGQKEQPEGAVNSSGTPCCDSGTACA